MLKKLAIVLVLSAALLAVGVYVVGGWILGAGTRAMLPRFEGIATQAGLGLARCEFAGASVRPPARLAWHDWRLAVHRLAGAERHDPAEQLQIRIGSVRVDCTDLAPLTVDIHVEDAALETPFFPTAPAGLPFASNEYGVAIERIDHGSLRIDGLPVGTSARAVLGALASDLRTLAHEGHVARPLRLDAQLHFQLKGKPLTVRLETERTNGLTYLRFNASDIAELSRRYVRPLTAAEQEILCDHPQRALLLLRIKEYAERLSQRLARTNKAYGEDFTRHVLWSYWLARTFGPDFAQIVTDAHEAGATDNTEAEHRQDFANNLVGRTYAAAKKTEGQVLRLIRTDPMIVRVAK